MTPPSLSDVGLRAWDSDSPFRTMVEASPDLIWVNETGRIVYINPAGLAALGAKEAHEVLGRSPLEFVHPSGRARVSKRISGMAKEGGAVPAYRQILVGVDGRELPVEVRASSLQTGENWAILVVCRDLSFREATDQEREALLERLEQNDRRLRIASRMGRLGGWEVDLREGRLHWSEEVFAIHEVEKGEEPGLEEAIHFYHPDCRERVAEVIRRCAEQGQGFEETWRLVTAKGRELWVRAGGEAVRDAEGEIVALRGVFQDVSAQVESEREASRAAKQLERTLESISEAFFTLDRDWRFTFVNGETVRLVGYRREDLLGRNVWEAFPEVAGTIVDRVYRAAMEQGQAGEFENYFEPLERWFEVRVFPAEEGIAVYFRDVTAQRAARERLTLLEACVERMNDVVLVTDAEPVDEPGPPIVFANPAFERLTGYRVEEVIGTSPRFLQGPGTDRGVLARLRKAMLEKRQERAEVLNYAKDGRAYWLEIEMAPVFDEQGEARHFVAVQRDVTESRLERERLAEALTAARMSEERFRYVAQAISDAIWDWDLGSDAVWWNDGFRRLFGYDPAEVEPDSRCWLTRIHPEDRERVERSIRGRIEGAGDHWTEHYRFRRKDGSYVEVEDRALVIRDASGVALRVVGGMRDESRRRREEQQLLRAQRMEAIGTLAGGIAHDLNNILSPITMSIGILKANAATRPLHGVLDTIEACAARGASVVRQVLSFARGLEGERVPVDPLLSVQEVAKMARETFPRSIRVELSVQDEELWKVTGDATQLHQAVLNLCVNARDAMPNGGTLRLELANVELDEAAVDLYEWVRPGRFVLIKVEDNGEGIPRELLDRVFDPFFTTKEPGEGTGLGLAMVGTISRSHGGFVKVYSQEGRGSSFMLFLPAGTEAETGEKAKVLPVAEPLPRGEGELVLVVDDEEPIRKLTRQALELQGYEVAEAVNGLEALSIYVQRQDEVRLVLTDMMMPEMDGAQLIAALAAMAPEVPVVAASGLHAKHGSVETVAGTAATLAKPFTTERLLQAVGRALGKNGGKE